MDRNTEALTSPSFPNGVSDLRSEAEVRGLSIMDVIRAGARTSIVHLNCPWCGSEPPLAERRAGRFLVGCDADDCPVNPQASGDTVSEAWAKWDARP